MTVQFGTDGIRGRAYEEITVDLAYRLGRAVATVFTAPVFVGYDTRESSPHLAAAVLPACATGARSAPTSATSRRPGSRSSPSSADGVGVVVSASHNPTTTMA
jgi:phosphoglucosamine mutase